MVSSASGRLLSLRGLAEYHPVNDAATTIISVETPPDDASPQSVAHGRGSALQALTTLTLVLCVLLTLLWGKQYARHWLLWLDSQDRETVCLVFLIMYTLVAFPLTWGYILLNFACGYHFGLVLGVAVTAGAATFGISVAHTVMKRFFLGFIMARLLSSDVVRSTLALLDTGHAFKVVIISRLTPIPFGLQNAMFAVSHISLGRYVTASALGLVPTQVINVYLGTTVRSMEEVLDTTAATGYAVLLAQVVLSIGLMGLIVRKARKELQDAVLSSGYPKVALDTAFRPEFPWIPVSPLPTWTRKRPT
ncbi:transmembrane protein 64 [Ixodes scapularis]|uniref:transmembrane protein 64 n=1 Tax=Ixodes scapularis TaxID=6945 RepID=UPI001A9CC60E|nr:transmembrane protein 64 [Ixodes scapularis]